MKILSVSKIVGNIQDSHLSSFRHHRHSCRANLRLTLRKGSSVVTLIKFRHFINLSYIEKLTNILMAPKFRFLYCSAFFPVPLPKIKLIAVKNSQLNKLAQKLMTTGFSRT